MCGCNKQTSYIPPDPEPWKTVSVSLLQMFLRPVQCRILHSVYDDVLTVEETANLQQLLTQYIAAKLADPNTQEYYEHFSYIQEKIDYIYKKNICL